MSELTLGFVSIIFLVLIQISMFAYGYGKLSQRVKDISETVEKNVQRLEKLEAKINEIPT